MNLFNIERALKQKVERNWKTIYWAVDAHGTIFLPYHTHLEFYPDAVNVLQRISRRDDMKLILWSSSHLNELESILELCKKHGIDFVSVNSNPLEADSVRACFDKKFYFNILLDDKAGFEPETDWTLIKELFIRLDL